MQSTEFMLKTPQKHDTDKIVLTNELQCANYNFVQCNNEYLLIIIYLFFRSSLLQYWEIKVASSM